MSTAPPDPAAAAAAAAAFQQFVVEAWTLLAVGIAITILRTVSRIRSAGVRGLGGDDYLAWLAVMFYIAETSLAYSVGNVANGLANNGMTDAQRAALSPDDPEYRLRLTDGLARHYRIRIYVGFAFLAASYIIVALNLYLSCRPFHKFWQIFPDPGNVCQPAVSNQIIWVYWAFNVTTDLYIISIPVPMLWGSSLKPLKKVGLMILFSGGLFVVVCATLRCVLIIMDTDNGAQLAGSWAVRETFVAVITTNLPMIFPLLKWMFAPILGSILTSMRSTQRLEDATPKDFITIGGSSKSWRGRGPPTVNPITNITMNESEERMVEDVRMQDLKAWSDSHCQGQQLKAGEESRDIRKDVEIDIISEDRLSLSQKQMSADERARRLQGGFPFPDTNAG
ncbi:hypothetical protein TARUN_8315 [Trichoderma arundinaceum]|uniref:Rhodopsin domain-containing protein n=1 Tax=Trichoderma arundinaceum TaxID=490622 RepID=A0A395NDA1_TRIAR|nr:hypothetical protein TARUN_8315 [Trichoderma arundinaceum]